MLISSATVSQTHFDPHPFYLSAHRPFSPKASQSQPPLPFLPQFWPNILHHFRGLFRVDQMQIQHSGSLAGGHREGIVSQDQVKKNKKTRHHVLHSKQDKPPQKKENREKLWLIL